MAENWLFFVYMVYTVRTNNDDEGRFIITNQNNK